MIWGFVDSPRPSPGPRQRWDRASCPAWPSTGLGGNLGHLLGLSALVSRQQWGFVRELSCFPCTDTDGAAGLEPLGTLPLSQEHHSLLFSALFRQILPAQSPWL